MQDLKIESVWAINLLLCITVATIVVVVSRKQSSVQVVLNTLVVNYL